MALVGVHVPAAMAQCNPQPQGTAQEPHGEQPWFEPWRGTVESTTSFQLALLRLSLSNPDLGAGDGNSRPRLAQLYAPSSVSHAR